jgi:hypothetical protein
MWNTNRAFFLHLHINRLYGRINTISPISDLYFMPVRGVQWWWKEGDFGMKMSSWIRVKFGEGKNILIKHIVVRDVDTTSTHV